MFIRRHTRHSRLASHLALAAVLLHATVQVLLAWSAAATPSAHSQLAADLAYLCHGGRPAAVNQTQKPDDNQGKPRLECPICQAQLCAGALTTNSPAGVVPPFRSQPAQYPPAAASATATTKPRPRSRGPPLAA